MGECVLDSAVRIVLYFRLQDYLLCVVCGLIAFGVGKVQPHCRPFSWTDSTIDFPYGGNGTFPSWTLPIISVLPAVVYVVGEAFRHLWWLPRLRAGRALRDSAAFPSSEMQGRRGSDGAKRTRATGQDGTSTSTTAATASTRHRRSISPFATSMAQAQLLVEVADDQGDEKGHGAARSQAAVGVSADDDGRTHDAAVPAAPASVALMEAAPGMTNRAAGVASPAGQRQTTFTPPSVGRVEESRHVASPASTSGPLPATAAAGGCGGSDSHRRRRHNGFVLQAPWQMFFAHAHMWVLTQAFAVTFAMMVVDTIKVYAGRLRPDFLARLRREGYTEASVEVDWCAAGKGGRVSFPSGHSAISFAAFVPFSFYLLHTLHVFRRGGTSMWCIVLGLVPLILPITVAVSRTRDNRHNFDDILAGSLIGIAAALIATGANLVVNGKTGQLAPRLPLREG